ncbi:S-adenosyl-L-methionine-dependent methyltransferase [Podospora conica]|nr:S-adenosyl-L-methionine-dependent methyltransferase [Schizothecium conicum]
MSEAVPPSVPISDERTFRSYTSQQGANYAEVRRDYHPSLYETIKNHHLSTGGQLQSLLDVGCGPGRATRSLATHFDHAVGIDPSEGMITTALALENTGSKVGPIRFAVSSAEALGCDLDPPVPEASVDLLTAATAAHWFNMPAFWERAALVVKPGGTVALWSPGPITVIPPTPNSAAVQAAVDDFEASLDPFMLDGNRLVRKLYIDLPLPWTLAKPVEAFDDKSFLRRQWGTEAASEAGGTFMTIPSPVDMATMEKILSTSSPVTRWRDAHPDRAGTEQDIVRIARRKIEHILHQSGVKEGQERLYASMSAVLLMVKRR